MLGKNLFYVLSTVAIGIYLVAASAADIRKRRIPAAWMAVCGICFIPIAALGIVRGELPVASHITGALAGGIFLLLGYASKEALGYGDGWSLVLIGLYLGARDMALISCLGLTGGAVFSMFLILVKKAGRKDGYPFIPFLCMGHVLLCVLKSG